MIFGVHPIHTEAVDVAFNRSEILACLGVVGALWWVWHWMGRDRRIAWAGAAAIFLLALLSRESAVSLPVVLVLALVLLPTAGVHGSRARGLLAVVALAAPLALYLWMRQVVVGEPAGGILRSIGADGIGGAEAPLHRLSLVAATVRDYWRMIVWPWPLRASYEDYVLHGVALAARPPRGADRGRPRRLATHPRADPGHRVLLCRAAAVHAAPGRSRAAGGALRLPAVGRARHSARVRSHRAGSAIGPVAGARARSVSSPRAWPRSRSIATRSGTAGESLWEAEYRWGASDWRVLVNLSQVRIAQGRLEEAVALCDRGLSIRPSQTAFHATAASPSPRWAVRRGRGVARQPRRSTGDSGAYANLGPLYVNMRRIPEAEEAYGEAMARETDPADRHVIEGERSYFCRGDAARAWQAFQAALVLSPELPAARQGVRHVAGPGDEDTMRAGGQCGKGEAGRA